jgi:hypothetical protein
MEVEMKMVKSLLLGAAAGFVAVAGAQAADMPVKAKPVLYVKICSLYGDGFYYIPGTNTCLKMGGYLRVQAEYNMGAGGIAIGQGTTEGAAQSRFNRFDTNDVNYRTRAAISWDVREQTEYGTLRTYIRTGVQVTTPTDTEAGGAVFWDRAFMQFAGFTVGKTQSFYDLFTYGGGMSYHNVRVAGDTGAAGLTVWAYTAQFGNGISGTVSAESPNGHNRSPVIDAQVAAFTLNSGITGDSAFHAQVAGQNGFRMPDVIANLRMDQAWGFVGVSGAIHDASGAYYGAVNSTLNGHPADKMGWAVAAGGQLNLPGGDQVGINFCYTQGAVGFCTNSNAWQIYNAGTSVGLAWAADGVFDTGTAIELTSVWSFLTGYQHIWNPKWRTSLFGGYVNVSYNGDATRIINSHLPGAAGSIQCGVAVAGAVFPPITMTAGGVGNSCSPNFSFYEVGTRTQYNPTPNLDIGLEVLYTHLNTAYKGVGLTAANGAQPAHTLVDDQNVWSAMFRWQRNFYP